MLAKPEKPVDETLGGTIDFVDDEGESEGEEEGEEKVPSAAESLERKIAKARELAKEDPKLVANIIMDWMNANAG